MSPDLVFFLSLASKMAITAALVVGATLAAERFGSLVGAMVATLPVAAAPAYVFLALDHDAAFIATSALGSLVSNAATMAFCTVYVVAAQSRGLVVSVAAALGAWTAMALLSRLVGWTVPGAVALNLAVLALCLPVARGYRVASMPAARRRWYDMPFRAAMVATVVAAVVTMSARLGPSITGIFAVFPIVLLSVVVIFHPRLGGPATATIHANAIVGLAGFSVALLVLSLSAVPLGSAAALTLSLAVSIGWNLTIVTLRRRAVV